MASLLRPPGFHDGQQATRSLYKDRFLQSLINKQNNRLSFAHTTLSKVLSSFHLRELICEELPLGMCSFSIASSGKRCLLETFESSDGYLEFQCKTSEVIATNMQAHIENDECVSACGVDRNSVGISSDSLLDTHFILKLCSPKCYYNCPNIIDLYQNFALAEGVLLPELCKFQITSSRRSVVQLQSSGESAAGPISGSSGPTSATAYAPISSTTFYSVDCAPAPI